MIDAMTPIIPTDEDWAALHAEEPPLPPDATNEQQADRYRLLQAYALIRLRKEGKLSPEMAAAVDRCGSRPRLLIDNDKRQP